MGDGPMAFTFAFLATFLMVWLGVPWFRRPGTQARRSKVACPRGAFEFSFLAADIAHFLSDVGVWQSQGHYQNATWTRFEFTSLGHRSSIYI